MKLQKSVMKEVQHIAVGTAACAAVQITVFAVLGRLDSIADNEGVNPDLPYLGKVAGQQVYLPVIQQGVAGQVKALAAAMGQLDRLRQLLLRKALGSGAHIKQLPAEIHRVRAEAQRRLQSFPVAGRRQNLRFIFY